MSYNNYSEQDERDANAVAGRLAGLFVFLVLILPLLRWIGVW